MVLLAFFSAFLATTGQVMFGLTILAVAWCSWRSSEMMVLAMDVQHERYVSMDVGHERCVSRNKNRIFIRECVYVFIFVCVCLCVLSEMMVLAMDVQYERFRRIDIGVSHVTYV